MPVNDELNVGDLIRDNDPRMRGRVLTITHILPNGVAAKDGIGKTRLYLRNRIHTDGKPRRGGFDLIRAAASLQETKQ